MIKVVVAPVIVVTAAASVVVRDTVVVKGVGVIVTLLVGIIVIM